MLVGYARVSTQDQNPNLQLDALKAAGCERTFVEKVSGTHRERPTLMAAIDYFRPATRSSSGAGSTGAVDEAAYPSKSSNARRRLPISDGSDRHDDGRRPLVFHIFGALAEFERAMILSARAPPDAARARTGGGRPPKLTEDAAAARAFRGQRYFHRVCGEAIQCVAGHALPLPSAARSQAENESADVMIYLEKVCRSRYAPVLPRIGCADAVRGGP